MKFVCEIAREYNIMIINFAELVEKFLCGVWRFHVMGCHKMGM